VSSRAVRSSARTIAVVARDGDGGPGVDGRGGLVAGGTQTSRPHDRIGRMIVWTNHGRATQRR
jgi:hypothetical protein